MDATLSKDRFSNQRVVLSDGTILTGKNVRIVSSGRFIDLGGNNAGASSRTIGDVRVNGVEIPVVRLRGRGGWRQAGNGSSYDATGFSFTHNDAIFGSWF